MKKPSRNCRQRRHRRVPVYAETPDQIVGVLDVKLFLLNPSEHYTEALIAPSFVPETMKAMDLLRGFLTHPQGLAIVVDEFGGTEGIVTLSDIIEEIMSDAAPLGDADLYIEPLEDGRFLVNGNARLDDLSEHLGFELEAEGIDTIGGFVFNRLGYLPAIGHAVRNAAPCHHDSAHGSKANRRNPAGKNRLLYGLRRNNRQRRDGIMIYGLLILCLWTVSFFFAGIEAGLLSIDPVRLRHHVKQRKPSALRLERLMQRPERLLITVLLVTNMADILGLLLLTKLLVTVVWIRGIFRVDPDRAPDLSLRARRSPEIAFPAISLSRPGGPGRRARVRVDHSLAGPGDRRAAWTFAHSAPGQRGRPALCRARGVEADRRAKRARRLAHLDRARHDPQRRRLSKRQGVRRDGAARKGHVRPAGYSDR